MILGVYLPLGFGLLCCVIFALSWRGKKLSGELHCRRCLYDLSGNPDASQCPECGSYLNQPRKYITHGRRCRKWLVYPSGVISILFLIWFVYVTTFYFQFKFNRYAYYPDSCLVSAVEKCPQVTLMSLCWNEIVDRLYKEKLKERDSKRLVQVILKMHQDSQMQWNTILGDCLWAAYDQGSMSEMDVEQFEQQLLDQMQIVMRKTVRQKDQLSVKLDILQVKCGRYFEVSEVDVKVPDIPGKLRVFPNRHDNLVLEFPEFISSSTTISIGPGKRLPGRGLSLKDRVRIWCWEQRLIARNWYRRGSWFNQYVNQVGSEGIIDGLSTRQPIDVTYTFPKLSGDLPLGQYNVLCDVKIDYGMGKLDHTFELNVTVVE